MFIKKFLSSFIAGIAGAIIGRFCAWYTSSTFSCYAMVLNYGIVTGFFSCLICAEIALSIMERKNWKSCFWYGALFGGLSGIFSGFITFSIPFMIWCHDQGWQLDVYEHIVQGTFGAIGGGFIGVISGLILGPILAKLSK